MKDVLYQNGGPAPLYELSGERFCVPMDVPERGRSYHLYMRVKVPDFASYKKALAHLTQSRIHQRGANTSEIVVGGTEPIAEFARNHFLELSGVMAHGKPLPQEKHAAFLAARSVVAEMTGLAALSNVSRPEMELEPDSGPLVWEDESDSLEIPTEVLLGDLEKQADIVVPVTHFLRQPAESDRVSYNKVTKTRTRSENKADITWSTTNYDSIGKIYGSLALSLHGAVIDGAECAEANKAVWLPRVPLPWMAFVLAEVFNRVSSKNG